MRWNGQRIGAVDGNALPGLDRLDGLVRSVTTPEFAGMTFHEVAARSALNHVPSSSVMPFSWTINPYRGCSHACLYCLSPDTFILRADGRNVPLRDINVGDEIIGTERQGAYRRYVRTTVRAKWPTRKRAHRVRLADGTELIASGDHRFLTDRGWKHVSGEASGAARRPHLTTNNRLMGFGVGAPREQGLPLALIGAAVKTFGDLRVTEIEDLGHDIEMLDISTGTGDFIANGVVSHNCYARGTHEYLELDAGRDFDAQIVVKVNIADVLRRELAKPGWQRERVALGTNTDPYQRAEGRYRLMPGIATALAESGTPFSILTKGTLLRRDLPLLTELRRDVRISLAMSIAIFDHALQQEIEPGTPSTQARLDTVRAAADAGFAVDVFMMPIIPHLTDDPAALDDALARVREAGARRVVFGAMHLRPGAKQWFLQWLERAHPELVPAYRGLYPGAAAYAPKGYRTMLAQRMMPLVRRHGLAGREEDDAPRPSRSRVIETRGARSGPVGTAKPAAPTLF